MARMHGGMLFIQDLAVILAVAGVVGWICQRFGLSVVVGFLVAGLLVGPHTQVTNLVSDIERVDTLAQLGLVFLMFGIGLKLSVRKLRRLGPTLLLAVACTAIAMYYLTRILGSSMGWGKGETLFLAGMLMVSSSAIISKVLHESGVTHERFGQLAMGVAVLEDVVAVVMLAVLNSVSIPGAAESQPDILHTLGRLSAFVVVAGIGGLLLVPWLLKKMSIAADEELQTLGIAGLLFVFAVLAVHAEYSLALGAFLLGTIVAETPHRAQVERTFEGMRDVFSAIFFVAIGMQIEPRMLVSSAGVIVGIAAFTIVARSIAATAGLTLIGTPQRDALRAGMLVTPIGEFSFIIAQAGITAGVLPTKFYPIGVGVCLLTTLAAPFTTRHSEKIADWVILHQPQWLKTGLQLYSDWRERVQQRRSRNIVWQLSRKRVLQLAVGILFVSGTIIFSEELFLILEGWLGRDWLFGPLGFQIAFWAALVAVTLAPLVAIWRNVSAMAMLYAEVSTKGQPNQERTRPLVERLIKIGAAVVIIVWLSAILPYEEGAQLLLIFSLLFATIAFFVLRRKLIYWHSELEVELQGMLEAESHRMTATTAPWLRAHQDWNLHMADCTLPDLADCQGRKISELELRARHGCTVVGIERQGFMIALPPPDTVLYPRDKVLIMGTTAQLAGGRKYLTAVSGVPPALSVFEEVRMEAVPVPPDCGAVGRTLGAIAPTRNYGVLVAGVNRAGMRILNPRAEEKLYAGDEVLTLGTPEQIGAFKAWLGRAEAERPETPLETRR